MLWFRYISLINCKTVMLEMLYLYYIRHFLIKYFNSWNYIYSLTLNGDVSDTGKTYFPSQVPVQSPLGSQWLGTEMQYRVAFRHISFCHRPSMPLRVLLWEGRAMAISWHGIWYCNRKCLSGIYASINERSNWFFLVQSIFLCYCKDHVIFEWSFFLFSYVWWL